jgi:hypothetical protein
MPDVSDTGNLTTEQADLERFLLDDATLSESVVIELPVSDSATLSESVDVRIAPQLRALYCYENVGIEALTVENRPLWVYENVGIEALTVENRPLWVYENVGIEALMVALRAFYQYEAVTNDPPFPYLEKITPTEGPEGSEIILDGDGFGHTQADYDGLARLGEDLLGIITWAWREIRVSVPNGAANGYVRVFEYDPEPPGERYSDGRYFIVLEEDAGNDPRFEIKLYTGNTLLEILEQAK